MSHTMTPLQSLLMAHLPAEYPQARFREVTGVDVGQSKRLLSVGSMPTEAMAHTISEGLGIPWAVLVDAVRQTCQGRPLPPWACRAGETQRHWQGYSNPSIPPRIRARAISASRWEKIVGEIRPARCYVVSAARLLLDWQAYGASEAQVEWAAQKLGVALVGK